MLLPSLICCYKQKKEGGKKISTEPRTDKHAFRGNFYVFLVDTLLSTIKASTIGNDRASDLVRFVVAQHKPSGRLVSSKRAGSQLQSAKTFEVHALVPQCVILVHATVCNTIDVSFCFIIYQITSEAV